MVTLLLRVSEVVRDLVANCDAGTVMRGLGEVVTLRVLVAACDAGTVKTLLRERVMVTLLLRVSEVVAHCVANCDAGTVKALLRERVKETLLVRVSDCVPDVQRLTVTERVSEPLADLVANWDPGTVKAELRERECAPEIVTLRVGLLVVDMEVHADPDTVGEREPHGVADMVPAREVAMGVLETEFVAVRRPDAENVALAQNERVRVGDTLALLDWVPLTVRETDAQ